MGECCLCGHPMVWYELLAVSTPFLIPVVYVLWTLARDGEAILRWRGKDGE